MYDPVKVAAELKWLQDNPDFQERPATIREFLGEGYLEIESKVRPGLLNALVDIFGEEVNTRSLARVQQAMVTGAIGIGKTTLASVAMPYMVHWVLCMKDPQDFFDLLPGSRIAFMQMSTSEGQAREVIFGDIFARIKHSPWFVANYPYDPKFTKQIRFPQKDIWVLPGDSAETTFEGYNIIGGILDEMDSHKITKDKDYAETGYTTIHGRIFSRFHDRGLLILIGQMKKATGFAARKLAEFLLDPEHCHVTRMTLWESFGWQKYLNADGTHDSFFYDRKRRAIIPKLLAELLDAEHSANLMEIPNLYLSHFTNKPEQALRDLAGIPPAVSDPFISLVDKIEACRDRWIASHGDQSPVKPNMSRVEFEKWFLADNDPRKRALHIDNAYSAEGDGLGIAMGHVKSVVERDGELKPYIVIDFLARIHASPGTEILFSDVRRIVYMLKDDLNFRLKKVSMDGFQSTDTKQQLRKKRFIVEDVSVDKSKLPYEDLREAIYDERIEFPPYMTYMQAGDDKLVEVAIKELSELTDDGMKIDHPVKGSKDVADAIAGVCYTLIGDRSYRRGLTSLDSERALRDTSQATGTNGAPGSMDLSRLLRSTDGQMHAPVPPMSGLGTGIEVPRHLRPVR